MQHKHAVIAFADYASGERFSVEHFRFSASDMWDQVENRAEEWARIRNASVDVHVAAVMPSGKVAQWDRAGMRVEV